MKKKQYVMMAVTGGAIFAAGFLAGTVRDTGRPPKQPAEEQTAEESQAEESEEISPESMGYVASDTIRVRIEDNQVQWFDGRLWHEAASVEELEREDRFCLAAEAFQVFDEQLRQEKAAERQARADQDASGTLSVGVKETPKPPQRPQTPPQAPADVPETDPNPADTGGGNPGGGTSQPANPGPSNPGPSTPTTPATPPPVAPPPADEPADSGNSGDTGDGENMEWSDDYL